MFSNSFTIIESIPVAVLVLIVFSVNYNVLYVSEYAHVGGAHGRRSIAQFSSQ